MCVGFLACFFYYLGNLVTDEFVVVVGHFITLLSKDYYLFKLYHFTYRMSMNKKTIIPVISINSQYEARPPEHSESLA